MIESIYVGMTGLASFSRGLRVIANNTTNLNTPGFKAPRCALPMPSMRAGAIRAASSARWAMA